ncbi:hypothetical protein C8R43DRAFT_1212110 [Mycena crocata]|nr:hypothetical protein C8R43DRAFT_1212110 [Mycena crocata]
MLFRNVSRRDGIRVFAGIFCFYIVSALITQSQNPSIIINALSSASAEERSVPDRIVTKTVLTATTATEYLSPEPTQTTSLDLGLADTFPETTMVAHAFGWTIFQNLYMANGALLIVTSEPDKFPKHARMTSTGLPGTLTNDPERRPTEKDMAFVTPEEARMRWAGNFSTGGRNRVSTVEGTTLLFNDPPQFLNHYYHFVAELIFGAWAFLYGAFSDGAIKPPSPTIFSDASFNSPLISNSTPSIDRAIFIHSDVSGWRDGPGFNAYFLRAAFPSMTVEVSADWQDRVASTSGSEIGRAWHFPLVLLADRSAAFRGPICGSHTQRTAANAWIPMARAGKIDLIGNWWASMRATVLRYAGGMPQEDMQPTLQAPETVVITYINRQGTRRHLADQDNVALVAAMEELVARKNSEGKKQWEFNNVQAERISRDEQVRIAGRSTILLGVHGNGLTHLVLMKPTLYSAVIEIFYPGGFAHDYAWTARSLGMPHYTVWNNTYHSHATEPKYAAYPEGFHGTAIPVDGPTVARLIDEHVTSREAGEAIDEISPAFDKY